MLLADIGLVADAMTAINVPPDLVEEIVQQLQANSEDLESQTVTRVGPGWFGGSTNGHRIAVNTDMAHQAVEEEMQKLADALRQYSEAITQWADEVRDVDGSTNAEMTMRASAVANVNAVVDDARQETSTETIGDGSYDETEGGA